LGRLPGKSANVVWYNGKLLLVLSSWFGSGSFLGINPYQPDARVLKLRRIRLRPEGSATYQPRAKRNGVSREASPWVPLHNAIQALKGRNKRCAGPSGLESLFISKPRVSLPLVALPWADMWMALQADNSATSKCASEGSSVSSTDGEASLPRFEVALFWKFLIAPIDRYRDM
jgi:hypothetical protein